MAVGRSGRGSSSEQRLLDSSLGGNGRMGCASFTCATLRTIAILITTYVGFGLAASAVLYGIPSILETSYKYLPEETKVFLICLTVVSVFLLVVSHMPVHAAPHKRQLLCWYSVLMILVVVAEAFFATWLGVQLSTWLEKSGKSVAGIRDVAWLRYLLIGLKPFVSEKTAAILKEYDSSNEHLSWVYLGLGLIGGLVVLELLAIVLAMGAACNRRRSRNEETSTLQRSNSVYYENRLKSVNPTAPYANVNWND